MALLTPIFYISGGILSGIIALSIYVSYRKSKNKSLEYLAISFIFLTLHSFFLSLPSFIYTDNLKIISIGYILGIIFLFFLLFSALRVQTSMNKTFFQKHSFIINTIILGIGITVITILINDFRLPIISANGIIFWNTNPIASWLIGGTSLIYGLMWADFFQQARRVVESRAGKIKMLVLSIDGITLGISAFLVFTSSNIIESIIGHSLFIFACLITLFIFLVEKKA